MHYNDEGQHGCCEKCYRGKDCSAYLTVDPFLYAVLLILSRSLYIQRSADVLVNVSFLQQAGRVDTLLCNLIYSAMKDFFKFIKLYNPKLYPNQSILQRITGTVWYLLPKQ